MKNNERYRRRSKRSRGRKRRLAALLAVFALVAFAVWWNLHRARSRPQLSHREQAFLPALPVGTPRPAAWTAAQLTRLRSDLNVAFAPAVEGADRWSFAVIGAGGRTIYDDRAGEAVTPASVQKLVVGSSALDLLGPLFRYHTLLASTQMPARDGHLEGNLWLVGSGDPSLRSEDLERGIRGLVRAGLRHVDGGVVVDASTLRGPEINPNWSSEDANEDFQAATSAISLDGDTAEFRIAGTTPGAPARVQVFPPSNVRIGGQITTSSAADDAIVAAMETPNVFELSGYIPAGVEEKYWLPVHDIPRYAGSVMQHLLARDGVGTGLLPAVGIAPLDAIALWEHRSAPLRVLEQHMLYVSDNHYAEQFLRTIGLDDGLSADDAGGLAAERRRLASRGVPIPGLHLVDGSGLARDDRIAAITLATILSQNQASDRERQIYDLLPQGGRDGTLANYDFTTALGRVRAKTGHMSGVCSLAGYVNTRHHGRIAFAFMVNGSPGDPDAAMVRAVDLLSSL